MPKHESAIPLQKSRSDQDDDDFAMDAEMDGGAGGDAAEMMEVCGTRRPGLSWTVRCFGGLRSCELTAQLEQTSRERRLSRKTRSAVSLEGLQQALHRRRRK